MSEAIKAALRVIWASDTPEAEAIRRAICAAKITVSK